MEGLKGRSTHDDTGATGHGLAAGPDAGKKAPGKERPALQGQPLKSQGGNAQQGRDLGRTQNSTDRADDAASPGRPAAKDEREEAVERRAREMIRLLKRPYRGREQVG